MNVQFVLLVFFVVSCLVQKSVCVSSWLPWNWATSKPKPVDGGWTPWSPWSSCQIPMDKDKLPYRHSIRNCTNPGPKHGGASCLGLPNRTSTCEECNIPLGLESGVIENSYITASDFHEEFPASSARLNGKSSWCTDFPDNLQEPLYLQVELNRLSTISAIATQGFYPPADSLSLRMGRVSKYQLVYSVDGVNWEVYSNSKNESVLSGNTEREGTIKNDLSPPVTARFVRILPLSYFSFICMKVELYGCGFNCGGSLTQTPGNILTESLPSEEQDCLWVIQLPNATKLTFDFINFNIPCNSGYAELRDGALPFRSAPLLARYCGFDHTPPPVSSSTGKLWVRYRSNVSDSQVGFYAIYFPGCGGHLQGSSGDITSPNFPDNYFHNSKCIWTITVPEGKSVHLEFVVFNVEGDSNRHRCPHDFLAVWNGSDTSSHLLGRFCNSHHPPPVICTSGRHARLKFRSDDALAWTGFHLTYRAVDPSVPCSKMFSSSIVTAVPSAYGVGSMYLNPSPIMTANSNFKVTMKKPSSKAQHPVMFSGKLDSLPGLTAFSANPSVTIPESYSVESNKTGLINTPSDEDLQAAKQEKDGDDDDEDDDLTTVIIISAFAFLVMCMILASLMPSIKHHCEKRRWEKEAGLVLPIASGIPATSSKESFEAAPVEDGNNVALNSASCHHLPYEENQLEQGEPGDNVTLSETNTAEIEQEEGSTGNMDPLLNNNYYTVEETEKLWDESNKNREVIDVEDSQSEVEMEIARPDQTAPSEMEEEPQEVDSLTISYEDLGSSFVSEMQAVLSQFADDSQVDEPSWNPSLSKNAPDSSQDSDSGSPKKNNESMESGDCIPTDKPLEDGKCNLLPDREAVMKTFPKPNSDSLSSGGNSEKAGDVWGVRPNIVSRPRAARGTIASGSCCDSKDSGCVSSCKNLPSIENYLPHAGNTETCV